MPIKIGLDVGGSTTKIVGMTNDEIVYKTIVKSNDPVTSAFGALGKLINDCKIDISDISSINITGVGAPSSAAPMLGIKTVKISEFKATGLGGLYLSGLDHAIVVSMGTGTAYLDASSEGVKHIIGSGVGGGTIVGLSNSVIGIDDAEKLADISTGGDISRVDLMIGDISQSEIPGLPMDVTASNFGKNADDLTREDKIAGIFNLVYQSIGTMAVLSARISGIRDIVFTGQLTSMRRQCKDALIQFPMLYDVNFMIPDDAVYATAIGACLCEG